MNLINILTSLRKRFQVNYILNTKLLFLLYINELLQAVVIDSLLYADDTCIVFQHQSEIEIQKQLIRDFSSACDWFVDYKLSIHFRKEKQNQYLVLNINFEMLTP